MEKPSHDKILSRIFKIFFLMLAVTFVALYFSQITGYYEYNLHKQVIFTEEQIKQFEKDVSEGKDIDIEDYLKDYNKNYQNKISKTGLSISNNLSKGVRSSLKYIFNTLNKWITGE